MKNVRCFLHSVGRGFWAVFLLLAAGPALSAGPQIFAGEPVRVGNGTARVIVATNSRNEPTSLSVVLTAAALEGLPEASPSQPAWLYMLQMPADAPETGFDHIMLDWNPSGHPPEGVYSVAHFDVHFYLVDEATQEAITFKGPGREEAMKAPDPSVMSPGYVIPPDTEVESMGVHAIDSGSREFHGHDFTYTFIYGYYKGDLIFVEPMLTVDFLKSKADVSVPVAAPQHYSFPGWYPTGYRIGYEPERGEYRIGLTGLRQYSPPQQAASATGK